jgi:hypothetical protein
MLNQYDFEPGMPPLPTPTWTLFVGTNYDGQVFDFEASTNLTDWSVISTGTDIWGVVSFIETNHINFRQRFFRAVHAPGP